MMNITLFTSNKIRHNYLINLLSSISDKLFVVQENGFSSYGSVPDLHSSSKLKNKYFEKVNDAQVKLFGNTEIDKSLKNIKLLPISYGDLNNTSLKFLTEYLKSDFYIIFGSSFIKNDLADFLIDNKAINIHMGVSPYYRGPDCNFWALYDNNPHLVGATIHRLSKGIDSGPMLYHAMSEIKSNAFEYTMSTVKSAFHSLVDRIKTRSILDIKPVAQDKKKQMRYTKKSEFNEKILSDYFKKNIQLNSKKFDNSLLKDPYFLIKS